VVEVKDTGPGIPPANQDRIFDPFYTTKPVGKGTGLGLSICYGIIKKMGGDISVHSVMDEGTTFTVEIPIGKASTEK
jgi:two-component system NtrC family sensor kinase